MDFIYFIYYYFYTRILTDNEPHYTVLFTLGFSMSLWLITFGNIVSILLFCVSLKLGHMIGLFVVILVVLYIRYFMGNRNRQVVLKYSSIHQNKMSFISIVTILISISVLFWSPILSKFLLGIC